MLRLTFSFPLLIFGNFLNSNSAISISFFLYNHFTKAFIVDCSFFTVLIYTLLFVFLIDTYNNLVNHLLVIILVSYFCQQMLRIYLNAALKLSVFFLRLIL